MKTLVKIMRILLSLTLIFMGISSLLELRPDIQCRLLHGKNICNFYKVIDMISATYLNPEKFDFEKAMKLCREMDNVPKKDMCFKEIAEFVSLSDKEKAKKACEEIKGFNNVYSKEDCLSNYYQH